MKITAEEVDAICDTLQAKPAQRERLHYLWGLGLGYRAAAKALHTTEDALRGTVKRIRQKARVELSVRSKTPVAVVAAQEPPLTDGGQDFAAWLLACLNGPVNWNPRTPPPPPEGDRDTIHARRLTVDDVRIILSRGELFDRLG